MRLFLAAAACAALAFGAGCAHPYTVQRVVDGRVVDGAYVEPEAYSAFLEGAIREEHGDLRGALASYVEAARHDDGDAEIWTRIAAVECAIDPNRPAARAAVERALAIDAGYGPAWGVRARCALARGEPAEDDARRATDADPLADDLQIVRAEADRASSAAARDRLVALTLVHGERAVAWEALAAWARAHGDATLLARAIAELGRRGFGDRERLAAQIEDLAGDGEIGAARVAAAGVVDGVARVGTPFPSDRHPLVARLAADEALLRGDADGARLRATRARLALDEVAARALLLGQPALARSIAAPVAQASPRAMGARMVLAVAASFEKTDAALVEAFAGARAADAPAPAEAALAYARMMADVLSPEEAARLFSALPHAPIPAGDAVVTRVAVDLAAAGAIDEAALPLDAAIELAVRRSQPPPDGAIARAGAVDARHELLALSVTRPLDPRTRALAARLSSRSRDALVAVALAKLELAGAAPPADAARLLDADPSDALVVAAALDLARRRGDTAAASRARAAMAAIARTPAERALVE